MSNEDVLMKIRKTTSHKIRKKVERSAEENKVRVVGTF